MSKYFLEVKNRVVLLLLTCISTLYISYIYKEIVLFFIVQPSLRIKTKKELAFFYFIFTNVTEVLTIYFELFQFLAIHIIFISAIYHCFIFLSPAFFWREYLHIKFLLKIFFIIWVNSIAWATYFFIPSTWSFFFYFQALIFNHAFNLHFEAKLNEYLFFYISLCYFCEFYCQFFAILLLFLNYISFNLRIIKKFRKLFYYCFVLFSIFSSTFELINQIVLNLTTIITYEFLVFLFLIKAQIKTNTNSYYKNKIT